MKYTVNEITSMIKTMKQVKNEKVSERMKSGILYGTREFNQKKGIWSKVYISNGKISYFGQEYDNIQSLDFPIPFDTTVIAISHVVFLDLLDTLQECKKYNDEIILEIKEKIIIIRDNMKIKFSYEK